jgi:hypothetical protein
MAEAAPPAPDPFVTAFFASHKITHPLATFLQQFPPEGAGGDGEGGDGKTAATRKIGEGAKFVGKKMAMSALVVGAMGVASPVLITANIASEQPTTRFLRLRPLPPLAKSCCTVRFSIYEDEIRWPRGLGNLTAS